MISNKQCMLIYIATLFLLFAIGLCQAQGPGGLVTFEETILEPQTVRSQYCNNPATNKGVEFLGSGGRIFEPLVATSTPAHAFTNAFPGDEFGEFKKIQIRFTTSQAAVSVKVGLDRSYGFGVNAHMWAYSSDTPGPGFVALDNIQLGTGPTEVLHELSVSSTSGNIRSVEIWFDSPAGNATHEIIDDLTFSIIGPPCVSDTAAPIVQISNPATNGQILQSSYAALAFVVNDSESGVAKIQVSFLNATSQELGSFLVCGGSGPLCLYDVTPTKASYDFYTVLPDDTKTIRVQAWDFANHVGQADRTINLVQIGYFNLWAQAMEITQATQPWLPTSSQTSLSGSPPTFPYPSAPTAVPLVAERTTVVRVYAEVEGTTGNQPLDNVRAKLRCFSNSTYIIACPGYKSINPQSLPPNILSQITVRPGDSLDTKRRDTQLSWNFVLPNSWTIAGMIHLEAVILPPLGLQECAGCDDAANHFRIASVTFEPVPPFTSLIHTVRTSRQLGTTVTQLTQAAMNQVMNYAGRRLPVDEATLPTVADANWLFDDFAHTTDAEHHQRCGRVTGELAKSFPNKANKKAVYALIDQGFPCAGMGGGGYAYGRQPDTLAEEVGHAVGLDHAGPPPGHGCECEERYGCPCKERCNRCDIDWPWPHGTIGAFGFDVQGMAVIPPDMTQADWHDFMSYGGPPEDWVSPRTWIRMFNAFTGKNLPYPTASGASSTISAGTALARNPVTGQASRKYLLVHGRQGADGSWGLPPAYEVEFPAGTADHEGEGEYSIALLSARGRELFVRRFSPRSDHVDTGDPETGFTLPPSFVEMLPLPEDVATLLVRRGDATLATISRSPHAPTVQVLSPTAAGFHGQPDKPRIIWTGQDADRQPLFYMIQYTRGARGGRAPEWQTLASDLTGQDLSLDLSNLPGSHQAMVRVLATDGINTSVATSPGFFVPGKPPVARIFSPAPKTVIREGDRLVLHGTASDLEDGLLSPDALSWYANRRIRLGTGRWLDVTTLPPGEYRIMLAATDSDGLVGTATVLVEVAKQPNTQPIAHAGPDRTVSIGRLVQLDGSQSSDLDSDQLVFHWSVVSQPPRSHVRLTDAEAMLPGFWADREGDYQVELIVHDGQVSSLPARVSVHVR